MKLIYDLNTYTNKNSYSTKIHSYAFDNSKSLLFSAWIISPAFRLSLFIRSLSVRPYMYMRVCVHLTLSVCVCVCGWSFFVAINVILVAFFIGPNNAVVAVVAVNIVFSTITNTKKEKKNRNVYYERKYKITKMYI